jgi:protein-tyrosine kinase
LTRLTEALERARAAGESDGKVPAADQAEMSDSSAQETWRFDDEPEAVATAAPPVDPADRLRDPMDTDTAKEAPPVDYPFAKMAGGRLTVGPMSDPTLVEQHRHLAASLHHAQLRSGARTVMVASAVEAEGKTTTAANVALTLSHSHQRQVLLIDADLRRPSLHWLLQLDNSVGLGDALKGTSSRVPLHRISPTLQVMTAGRPMQDPMSALVSDAMRQFLLEAAERFDWVIIDTPPVALLSDANLLAEMIDHALLVVRAATTPYPLVKRAIDAIGPDRILGVVLNRAKRSNIVVGYEYYYGYSYGQSERPKKRSLMPFRRSRKTA